MKRAWKATKTTAGVVGFLAFCIGCVGLLCWGMDNRPGLTVTIAAVGVVTVIWTLVYIDTP